MQGTERESVPEVSVQFLLKPPTVTIGDVCCEGRCRGKSAEEWTAATELVFPYRGVYVRHVGNEQAVAEANPVLQAADVTNIRFFINARTDIFFQRPPEQHNAAMVVEAIERARAYADAGADGIFGRGLVDISLIARLAEESLLPLKIMIGDATPPVGA